jgi:hypothetical protein
MSRDETPDGVRPTADPFPFPNLPHRESFATDLVVADAELADHVDSCPNCLTGRACGDGDDAAEREYRGWAQYRDSSPDQARAYRRAQIETNWPNA